MKLLQHSPDHIVSNQVLEYEQAEIVAQITQFQASKKLVPDELQDKKNAYEIRMNMLVTMVQLGKLTMEGYIQQVKKSIVETKKMAIEFKHAQKLDLAKRAMTRIKLMTAEVEEVEQSQ